MWKNVWVRWVPALKYFYNMNFVLMDLCQGWSTLVHFLKTLNIKMARVIGVIPIIKQGCCSCVQIADIVLNIIQHWWKHWRLLLFQTILILTDYRAFLNYTHTNINPLLLLEMTWTYNSKLSWGQCFCIENISLYIYRLGSLESRYIYICIILRKR